MARELPQIAFEIDIEACERQLRHQRAGEAATRSASPRIPAPARPAVTSPSDDSDDDDADYAQIDAEIRSAAARRQSAAAAVAAEPELSAVDEFESRVAAVMATGRSKAQATRDVVLADSDLHRRYVAEVNARR